MATNQYVNKVEFEGDTLMDLTGDTVTPQTLLQGATAHDRSGAPITGAVVAAAPYDSNPEADGTASPGVSDAYARGDHVHPMMDLKTINSMDISGSGNINTGKVTADAQTNSVSIYEGTNSSVQISKVNNDTIRMQGYGVDDREQSKTLFDMSLPTKAFVEQGIDATAGDLSQLLTTDQSSLVNAINEVYEKSGEPFRVKQWAVNTLNETIPTCTTDVGNTSIPKLVFTIDDVEGADYQIVGMIAYEVFDAASGGSRINCWPVCQFTGNGQKELSVRFMCGGTQPKTAKRISAWVLLKHR